MGCLLQRPNDPVTTEVFDRNLRMAKSLRAPDRPWVPILLHPLPTNSTPSSRPDTSRRPGDLPWRVSCRRASVDTPGTLWVHRRMPDCERSPGKHNTFSCLFSSSSPSQSEDFGAFAFEQPFWE